MSAFDLAVVGGGPAGLSCATTAQRLGLRTVLFEAMALGGELATLGTLSDLPWSGPVGGPDVAAQLMDVALDVGVQVEFVEISGIAPSGSGWTLEPGGVEAAAVVLATGAHPDLGRWEGAQERFGRGVSVCSSCDGPLFKAKSVAVIGGGQYAARMAEELGAFASSVTVISPQALSASSPAVAVLESSPGVTVLTGARLDGFVGNPVDAIVVEGPAGTTRLEVQGVFIGTGRVPRLADLGLAVPLVDGHCAVDEQLTVPVHANAPLLAVGDVRSGTSETVAGAIGDGVAAAWSAARLLRGVSP